MPEKTFRYGKIEQMDRSFDIDYWQSLGTEAIMKAAWEMVVFAHEHKGGSVDELRLQRSIATFGKIKS